MFFLRSIFLINKIHINYWTTDPSFFVQVSLPTVSWTGIYTFLLSQNITICPDKTKASQLVIIMT